MKTFQAHSECRRYIVDVGNSNVKINIALRIGGYRIRVSIVRRSWQSGFRRCTYKCDLRVH